jgi:hypothetical protein
MRHQTRTPTHRSGRAKACRFSCGFLEVSVAALLVDDFSDIHAELRNLIYSYTIGIRQFQLRKGPGNRSLCRHNSSLDNWRRRAISRNPWDMDRRQWLGLTQVCRQLRTEYLSLHKASLRYTMRLPTLQGFVPAHFPLDGMKKQNVVLYLKVYLLLEVGSFSADVLPLLKLCAIANTDTQSGASTFEVSFIGSEQIQPVATALNGLMQQSVDPAWKSFVAQHLSSFVIRLGRVPKYILSIKAEYFYGTEATGSAWCDVLLGLDKEVPDYDKLKSLREQWLENIGLRLPNWEDCMEIVVDWPL